jgi:membrane-associated phospholipid phosphatase
MKQPLCRGFLCCTLLIFTAAASHAQLVMPGNGEQLATTSRNAEPQFPDVGSRLAPPASPTGIGWLVGSSLRDFKRLPSMETASILATGAAVAFFGGVVGDRATSNYFSQSPTLDVVMEPGETLGGARMQLIGALTTYGAGRLTQSPRIAAIGGDLLRAQLLSQAVTTGLKMSIRRTRPDGARFSFPSGHSSVTFASATVLHSHLGPKVGVPAYAVATYVAASRIQERRHYLSDVAFGAAVGIMAGRTVTVGRGDARFALAPVAVPGGGAVSFNWLGTK